MTVPGAAPENGQSTIAAIGVTPGRPIPRRTLVIVVPTVLDPFPDIAMHVEQAEGIRGIVEGPNRPCPIIRAR